MHSRHEQVPDLITWLGIGFVFSSDFPICDSLTQWHVRRSDRANYRLRRQGNTAARWFSALSASVVANCIRLCFDTLVPTTQHDKHLFSGSWPCHRLANTTPFRPLSSINRSLRTTVTIGEQLSVITPSVHSLFTVMWQWATQTVLYEQQKIAKITLDLTYALAWATDHMSRFFSVLCWRVHFLQLKLVLITNRKSHMSFIDTKLGDLEWPWTA